MTTIKLKNGSGAPLAGDLVAGEPALDLTNKRLYTEDSGGTVIEVGTNPTSVTTGTLTTTGSVGIGTGSPSSALHVKGSGHTAITITGGTANDAQINFGDTDDEDIGAIHYDNASNVMKLLTNAAEAMRIDASGNLLVGTTTITPYSDTSGTGMAYRDDVGILSVKAPNIQPLIVNRISSDGAIADFRKNGATVGSIGAVASQLYIAGGDTGLQLNGTSDQIRPCDGSGAARDAAIDLGDATRRFKDLYLSGGVIVNGSAAFPLSLTSSAGESIIALNNTSTNGRNYYIISGGSSGSFAGGMFGIYDADALSVRMAIDSSGNLLVGTTSTVNSAKMSVNGNLTSFVMHPAVDNNFDCGHPSYRWDDIRATNGTIQTSDRNEKQDIEALSDAEQRVAVAAKGLLRKFRWIDSVKEKGDDARIHFGIIAQDLQDAFTAEGLDAGRYAMFISDTWWESTEVIPAVEAQEAVVDEEGNVVEEAVEAQEERTVVNTYDTAEEAPEGSVERTRLGVRYPQLLAFIIAAI